MHGKTRDRLRRWIRHARQQTAGLRLFAWLEPLLSNWYCSGIVGPAVPFALFDAEEMVGAPEDPAASARVEAVVGDVKRPVRSEGDTVRIAETPRHELRLSARRWNAEERARARNASANDLPPRRSRAERNERTGGCARGGIGRT